MAINPMLLQALVGNAANSAIPFGQQAQSPMPSANPLGLNIPAPPVGGLRGAAQNFQNAGGFNALMGNPLFGAGVGMLSAAHSGGNPWQAALGGIVGTQVYKNQQQKYQLDSDKAKAEREQLKTVADLATKALGTIDVDQDGNISPAEQARADYLKAAATTGDQQYLLKANETLASLQPAKKTTSQQINLEAAGLEPGTPEYQDAMLEAIFRPSVQVNNQERIPPPERGYRYVDPNRPELGTSYVPGGGADPSNPQNWTEGERVASGYRQRMQAAEQALSSVPTPTNEDFYKTFGTKGTLQNLLSSPQYREYNNLASDWIRSKLRKESGAVIGEEEMQREYELYFWQPGDNDADSRRKFARRLMADRQMALSAGRAVVTPENRAQELREQGFDDEQVAEQLLIEGLIR